MPTIEKYKKQEDRKKQAYQHFINKGYSPEASAGIVGNLLYESGLDTSIEGDKGYKGGSSFGIAQFRGERFNRLKSRYGENWTDFNNQLEFVDWELNNTHKKAGDLLKKANDVHYAGQVFSDLYEIPAKKYKQNKDRASKVEQVYQTLVVTPQNTTTQEAIVNQDYVPPTQSTTTVTNLPTPTENVNFTAEINKLEQQAKDKELAFLQEYKSTFTTPEEYIQQEQASMQVPRANLTDIFNQVSQFVDAPIMAQQGVAIKDNIPNLYPPLPNNNRYTPTEQFTIEYIQSPKYRERLISQGYENPDQEIQIRLNSVRNVKTINQDGIPSLPQQFGKKITNTPYSTVGSKYDSQTNTVIMDPKTDKVNVGKSIQYNTVKAHELGHSEISDGTTMGNRLNDKDEKELINRLKVYELSEDFTKEDREKIKPDNIGAHDYKPEENKSDLNALRYLLKQEGIYDTGKETFKKEHLKNLPDNFIKQRLLKNYKEEDLIWLMNNIALNETPIQDTSYAQQGGTASTNPNYIFEKGAQSLRPEDLQEINRATGIEFTLEGANALFRRPPAEEITPVLPPTTRRTIQDLQTSKIVDITSGTNRYTPNGGVIVGDYKKVWMNQRPEYYAGKPEPKEGQDFIYMSPQQYNEFKVTDGYKNYKAGYPTQQVTMFQQGGEYQKWLEKYNLQETEDYNLKRAFELGYTPDDTGHLPSVDEQTGEWLKRGNHPTRALEMNAYLLNPEVYNNYNLIKNEQGKLQYIPKKQQGGLQLSENEIAFLSEIAVKDNKGYWNPNNEGKVVEINSPNISMKNLNYDVLGISKQTGEQKLMKPGQEYFFPNTKNVIEIKKDARKR